MHIAQLISVAGFTKRQHFINNSLLSKQLGRSTTTVSCIGIIIAYYVYVGCNFPGNKDFVGLFRYQDNFTNPG